MPVVVWCALGDIVMAGTGNEKELTLYRRRLEDLLPHVHGDDVISCPMRDPNRHGHVFHTLNRVVMHS